MTEHTLNIDLLKITLGPIAALLDDPEVTDVFIYGPERVFVKRQGRKPERAEASWASPEDLMTAAKTIGRHVKRRLDVFMPGGGFVFAQEHNILPDVPPENIVAMYDAIHEWNESG